MKSYSMAAKLRSFLLGNSTVSPLAGMRAALPALVLTCALLAACTPSGPADPTVSEPTSSAITVDTSAVPTSVVPPSPVGTSPVPTSAVETTPNTTEPSTTEPPPLPEGTVVPFRTVTPGSADGKRIGLLAPSGADALSNAIADSVKDQLDLAGAEVISCDPGDDPALVLDCALRLATQQVDGWIALQPGDLGESLCDAGPKDVPLIAISASPASCQTAVVGVDHQRAGFLVGAALGVSSKTMADCTYDAFVIFSNGAANIVSDNRAAGIRAGFATECPGPIVDEILLDAGSQDRAFTEFATILAGLPEDAVVLVAAVNDAAALGASASIPELRIDHVTLAAIGADQQARCMIVANPQWIGDAALFPDRYGEVAVPALFDALDGRVPPPSLYVETTFLNASNISSYYDETECATE